MKEVTEKNEKEDKREAGKITMLNGREIRNSIEIQGARTISRNK